MFKAWIFLQMFAVPSNDILEINEKCCKAKPNANRCFPIHVGLTSHIQPQLSRLCRKTCRTLTSQNADGSSPQSGFERHVNQKILHIRLFLSLGIYLSLLRMNAMKHNYIVIERTPLSLFHINNILITLRYEKIRTWPVQKQLLHFHHIGIATALLILIYKHSK